MMYHLPIFFLAIKGATAGEAGAHLLPTSIGNVIGGFVAGFVLHRTGKYYVPSAVAGFGAGECLFLAIAPAFVFDFSRSEGAPPLAASLDLSLTSPPLPVLAVLLISQLTATSSPYHQWLSVFPMGFGFVYMLNSSLIALLAATDNTAVPALTGALWLFRSAGQVVGVASTSAIMQGVLAVTLEQRITGKGSAKVSSSFSAEPTLRACRTDWKPLHLASNRSSSSSARTRARLLPSRPSYDKPREMGTLSLFAGSSSSAPCLPSSLGCPTCL